MGIFDKAEKLIKDTMANNSEAYKGAFAVKMLRNIARDTPVKSGLATGNWILQAGSPNLAPKNFKDISKTATITTQRAEKAARKAPAGADLYISNAVEGKDDKGRATGEGYIIQLERGKSVQSPAGMMFHKNVALAKVVSLQAKKEIFR